MRLSCFTYLVQERSTILAGLVGVRCGLLSGGNMILLDRTDAWIATVVQNLLVQEVSRNSRKSEMGKSKMV